MARWLPDGRLLITSDRRLLRTEPDGSMVTHADLTGGEVLQTIELDRGCFACALGGADRRKLFLVATEWNGPANMFQGPRTGQVLTVEAPAPGVGWP
jgi:sugar lactone lactonase YvrE